MRKTRKIGIDGINVEQLFGLYDYDIPGKDEMKKIERILILYGDNGSGKTTILRLIFHLLACERRQNHKTFVAHTKFKSLSISFNNGYEIIASRKGEELRGSFQMSLIKGVEKIASTEFLADSENFIDPEGPNEEDNSNFLATIGKLNLTLYLLGDDRTVKVTNPRRLRRRMYKTGVGNEGVYVRGQRSSVTFGEEREFDPEQISIRLVEDSLRRLRGWIRNHVMRGSTRGETNVNVIFSNIIDQIASEKRRGPRKKATRREYLVERIKRIEKRNKDFSKYGLSPSFNGQKLLDALDKASTDKFKSIRPIIVPYLASFEAKLDALNEIQVTIERFISTINSFMVDKSVTFSIGRDFNIISRNKEILSPSMLSSGERHLLLLFCNAVTALDEQSIFIIDEPEISLNVKWQRNLISSLVDLARGSSVQYLFASHSFEIISQHSDKVVKLVSKKDLYEYS